MFDGYSAGAYRVLPPYEGTQYFVTVHDPADRLSTDELTRIGQGLQFDNLDKPDTWHPVP